MKKIILAIVFTIALSGCADGLNPEKMLESTMNPFKEYSINDTKIAKQVEVGILNTEADKYGLNLEDTSAHMISFKKIGTYGTGEVRILGKLTEDGIEMAKEKRFRDPSSIVTYTCKFEYSYKNERYTWVSDFPYNR